MRAKGDVGLSSKDSHREFLGGRRPQKLRRILSGRKEWCMAGADGREIVLLGLCNQQKETGEANSSPVFYITEKFSMDVVFFP